MSDGHQIPALLAVEGLIVTYGKAEALRDVSIDVRPGEFVTIIGSNGAGKSTLLRAVSGLVRPAGGVVRFAGRSITGDPAHAVARAGLIHVPEGRELFPSLTVEETLLLGLEASQNPEAERIHRAYELFPRLRERSQQRAGSLSGGEQQMLALARGLMGDPKLLLLDEPSLGLAPAITQQIFAVLESLRGELTVLLVEQNARLALKHADRAYILERGRLVSSGSTADFADDEVIRRAYLGIG